MGALNRYLPSLAALASGVVLSVFAGTVAPSPPATAPASRPATRPVESDQALEAFLSETAKSAGWALSAVTFKDDLCTITITNARQSNFVRFLRVLEQTDLAIVPVHVSIQAPRTGVDNLSAELDLKINVERPSDWVPPTTCMALVASVFPEEANTIWLTSMTNLKDSHTWEMEGRCSDWRYAQELYQRMTADGRFADTGYPRLLHVSPALPAFRMQFVVRPAK